MGEIQGASKAQILRHITLPLILPSVLSATVMTISKSIGTYGVPANLGNRIGYYTLATKMRNFIDQGPQAVGYAMSIVLVLLAALIIFSNQRIVGVRKSYATVSGKGGRATLMPLGKAKKPLMAFLMVFLFLAMVVPFFVLIMETFQITTGAGYGLDNLTLYNWIGKSGQHCQVHQLRRHLPESEVLQCLLEHHPPDPHRLHHHRHLRPVPGLYQLPGPWQAGTAS